VPNSQQRNNAKLYLKVAVCTELNLGILRVNYIFSNRIIVAHMISLSAFLRKRVWVFCLKYIQSRFPWRWSWIRHPLSCLTLPFIVLALQKSFHLRWGTYLKDSYKTGWRDSGFFCFARSPLLFYHSSRGKSCPFSFNIAIWQASVTMHYKIDTE